MTAFILSALAPYASWIMTIGAGALGALALYLKGRRDKAQADKIKDITNANDIRKAGADARARADDAARGDGLRRDDGWRRE